MRANSLLGVTLGLNGMVRHSDNTYCFYCCLPHFVDHLVHLGYLSELGLGHCWQLINTTVKS